MDNMGRKLRINQIKAYLWALSFLFPIALLMGWVALNEYQLIEKETLTLPVEGYDPRDLLSGYYLTYKVQYGVSCPKTQGSITAYICFKPKKYLVLKQKPKPCTLFLKGQCSQKTFFAPIDRYYITEKKAKKAETLFIKARTKQVVVAVSGKGKALVQDILVDGISLKKQLD